MTRAHHKKGDSPVTFGRFLLVYLATALFFLCLGVGIVNAAEYSFGIVPQFEQRKLYSIWKPIIDSLAKQTNLKFNLITTLRVEDFEQEFLKGTFDFAYINPYFIAKTANSLGYVPLLRDRSYLRGILLVRKDGPVQKVEDLQGKKVAFPTPNSLAGCMIMKADLHNKFNVSVSPFYAKTTSNCYLHLLKGLADAAAVPDKTFSLQDATTRDMLRILYETREIPPHPITANPRVNVTDREKVRNAFLNMANTPEGRELLAKIPIKDAVTANLDEYLTINKLSLDQYWDPSWKEE